MKLTYLCSIHFKGGAAGPRASQHLSQRTAEKQLLILQYMFKQTAFSTGNM